MKYFCEIELCNCRHFFIADVKFNNDKIKSYELMDNKMKILDLDKNISILNSSSHSPSTHNLLFIYMLLSELCADENARIRFSEKASELAYKQVNSGTDNLVRDDSIQ